MKHFAILFLTRSGCHLCDQARPSVFRAAKRSGAEVIEVDIDSEDDLISEFGLRIPVVLGPDDRVLAEGNVVTRSLRRELRHLRRTMGD